MTPSTQSSAAPRVAKTIGVYETPSVWQSRRLWIVVGAGVLSAIAGFVFLGLG